MRCASVPETMTPCTTTARIKDVFILLGVVGKGDLFRRPSPPHWLVAHKHVLFHGVFHWVSLHHGGHLWHHYWRRAGCHRHHWYRAHVRRRRLWCALHRHHRRHRGHWDIRRNRAHRHDSHPATMSRCHTKGHGCRHGWTGKRLLHFWPMHRGRSSVRVEAARQSTHL